MPATLEKLAHNDAFIVDNGDYIFFYIGNYVSEEFVQQVFGYQNFNDLKFSGVTAFVPLESEVSQRLSSLIEQIRTERGGSYPPMRMIYVGDNVAEKEFQELCLVEDSADINKEFPYSDFLCMLHKLIRNKTS